MQVCKFVIKVLSSTFSNISFSVNRFKNASAEQIKDKYIFDLVMNLKILIYQDKQKHLQQKINTRVPVH